LKKHNNSRKKSEPTTKRAKSGCPVQRDTKEVLAELVGKLKEKLDPKKVAATSAGEEHQRGELRPNLCAFHSPFAGMMSAIEIFANNWSSQVRIYPGRVRLLRSVQKPLLHKACRDCSAPSNTHYRPLANSAVDRKGKSSNTNTSASLRTPSHLHAHRNFILHRQG
jgi:hypothetical protein